MYRICCAHRLVQVHVHWLQNHRDAQFPATEPAVDVYGMMYACTVDEYNILLIELCATVSCST